MMQAAAGVTRVVFVNVDVPRPWEAADNAVLAAGVARYPGVAVLADWYALSVRPPGVVHPGPGPSGTGRGPGTGRSGRPVRLITRPRPGLLGLCLLGLCLLGLCLLGLGVQLGQQLGVAGRLVEERRPACRLNSSWRLAITARNFSLMAEASTRISRRRAASGPVWYSRRSPARASSPWRMSRISPRSSPSSPCNSRICTMRARSSSLYRRAPPEVCPVGASKPISSYQRRVREDTPARSAASPIRYRDSSSGDPPAELFAATGGGTVRRSYLDHLGEGGLHPADRCCPSARRRRSRSPAASVPTDGSGRQSPAHQLKATASPHSTAEAAKAISSPWWKGPEMRVGKNDVPATTDWRGRDRSGGGHGGRAAGASG